MKIASASFKKVISQIFASPVLSSPQNMMMKPVYTPAAGRPVNKLDQIKSKSKIDQSKPMRQSPAARSFSLINSKIDQK